jgi:hypothetical protein
VPNIAELRTILLEPFRCRTSPCVDPVFGPTQAFSYWSSTTFANFTGSAWLVSFGDGFVANGNKSLDNLARAVRGGR